MREAYRLKGWSFSNPEGIAQCVKEDWSKKMEEQKDEGCQLYGALTVNKVCHHGMVVCVTSTRSHNAD